MSRFGAQDRRWRAFSLLAAVLCTSACAADPCVVSEEDGVATLACPDSLTEWAVPSCGNAIEEAGEACDNGTRECTPTCERRPGVSCSADDSLCVCDPAIYPSVFHEEQITFYYRWLSLNEPDKGSHPFDGATTAVPGQGFAMFGELGFDCDTGTTAPRLVIAPGRPHAFVALPFDAVDGSIAAATTLVQLGVFRYYLPNEWIDRTLLVEDEDRGLYKVDVRSYAVSCLADVQNDEQLMIQYRARRLWCPDAL